MWPCRTMCLRGPARWVSSRGLVALAILLLAAGNRVAHASASTTYQLTFDASVSPELVLKHRSDPRNNHPEDEPFDRLVPPTIAEGMSAMLGSELIGLWLEQKRGSVQGAGKVGMGLNCFPGEGNESYPPSTTCLVNHAERGMNFHVSATLYYAPLDDEIDGAADRTAVETDAVAQTKGEGRSLPENVPVAARVDVTMTGPGPNFARDALVQAVPKLVQELRAPIDPPPVWSVSERPSPFQMSRRLAGEEGAQRNTRSAATLESAVLSDPHLTGKRPVTPPSKPKANSRRSGVEIWQYKEPGSRYPTRSLFIDSVLRATTRMASTAHAEAFAHPALLAHPNPARVAVLSTMPIATVREVLKHESVREVTVVGADSATLDLAKQYLHKMNDCSWYESGISTCMEDEMVEIVTEPIEDWLEDTIEEIDEDEIDPFDVLLVDVATENSDNYLLSFDFHDDLQDLLTTDSILVINSGSEPSMDRDYGADGVEYGARGEFLRQITRSSSHGGLGYAFALVYEEPLASPLDTSFIIAFPGDLDSSKKMNSYTRYVRKNPASIDLDIVSCLYPSTKDPPNPLTLVYDGPTHLRHLTPSRAWEYWYCNTRPGRDLDVCRTFLRNWFDRTHHHDRTEIRKHPVKGRAAYAVDDIPEGHFVLAEDTVYSLMIDADQWMALNDFVGKFPEASMYTALKDFFIAYGYESDIVGKSGWSVALACNNTFMNHACTAEERSVSSLEGADLDEDGDWLGFSPVVTRRADIFGILAVAVKDIKEGEEIMSDYSEFRSFANEEFADFLDQVCDTGEGLVEVKGDGESKAEHDGEL